jgi:hypothetical protein
MKRSWGLPITLMMIIVMSSSSGCLGLLQMRETMEDIRDAPELKKETIKITHLKVFDNPTDWEEYQNTSSIYIDESVIDIMIYQKVKITGSDLVDGCLEDFTRYVRAELLSPTGEAVWAIDVCENVDAKTDQILPTPTFETGTWKLVITARGGGTQSSIFQDQFQIDLTIHRTCTTYPLEEDRCI